MVVNQLILAEASQRCIAGQLVQLDSWTAQQIAAGAEWNEIPEYPGTCGRILAEFHGTRQRPLFCASRRLLDADERTADDPTHKTMIEKGHGSIPTQGKSK